MPGGISCGKETLKHGGTKDHLIFKAYDDASSTFPTGQHEPLKIIDGRDMGIGKIMRALRVD